MGREGKFFGRVELIEYQGQRGANRFILTKPPALGTLGCTFSVGSLDRFLVRAKERGIQTITHDRVETLFGAGPMCTLSSPAGLRIDVFERAAMIEAPDRAL